MPRCEAAGAPIHSAPMVGSLGIVLPAYNEEARLGPALDELFAYLCTAPAAPPCPSGSNVLVVDDGSTDGTAALVRARPEYVVGAGRRHHLRRAEARLSGSSPGQRPARRQGLGRSGRDARRGRRPARLRRRRHGHAAGPVAAAGRRHSNRPTSPWAAASRPTVRTCAPRQPAFRRLIGRLFRFAAQVWVTGPIKDTQCGFKGFRREVARDLFGRLQDHEHRVRRGSDLSWPASAATAWPIVPIRWADRRGSRMHARPRLALRVALGPPPHPLLASEA